MPKPAAELQLNQCDAIERWHALLEEVKGALCMIFFLVKMIALVYESTFFCVLNILYFMFKRLKCLT